MAEIERVAPDLEFGRVTGVMGMLVELGGAPPSLSVGDRCEVMARGRAPVPCEVIGFRAGRALMMPFGPLEGVGLGCKAVIRMAQPVIHPHPSWLGRALDAIAQPVDGAGPLILGTEAYPLRAAPPPAHGRRRVTGKIDLGVRAINTFLTCCRGQRMGIFAASGVGKSVLLSMLAKYTVADVNVIGLIGERGREVQEFIEENLGPEGMARTVLVIATSDEPPLMRRQAAYLTLAIAEYFRDQGKNVLCMIDSITRFAQAQREIGLSAGEPPATKGYTPTVFAEIPKVLERAGPGTGAGTITGLFTVLVEGDDHDEPVADAVRATLDGHIVLDRQIAERGRYPAINVLRSVSRVMPNCNTPEENALVARARALVARYEDMADMIRLGAYRKGADAETDAAIAHRDALEAFLAQDQGERAGLADGYARLAEILAANGAAR